MNSYLFYPANNKLIEPSHQIEFGFDHSHTIECMRESKTLFVYITIASYRTSQVEN